MKKLIKSVFGVICGSQILLACVAAIVDPDFSCGSGPNGKINSICVFGTNKILVGGAFTSFNSISSGRIVAINSTGTIDNNFQSGLGFNDRVMTILYDSFGRLIIGGAFTHYNNQKRIALSAIDGSGNIITNFNPFLAPEDGGQFDSFSISEVDAVAQDQHGNFFVGGYIDLKIGTDNLFQGIVKITPDGIIDRNFKVSMDTPWVDNVIILPDNKVIVSGWFQSVNNQAKQYLVRLNSDGSVDKNFDASAALATFFHIYSLSLQQDGKLLVGGFAFSFGKPQSPLIRLNSDGTLDTNFNLQISTTVGSDPIIYTTEVDEKGKIYFGGSFNVVNGFARTSIASVNGDGSLDMSFAPKLSPNVGSQLPSVYKIKIYGSHLYIAGAFDSIDNQSRKNIARLKLSDENDVIFEIWPETTNVVESATNILLSVYRIGNTNTSASVGYTTIDNTALAGIDYQYTNGVLTFEPGESVKQINISLIDDQIVEPNKSFFVDILNPSSGASLGLQKRSEIKILDNDINVNFSITNIVVDELVGEFAISVTCSGTYTNPVEVYYCTAEIDSAKKDIDFQSITGKVVFLPGSENSQNIRLRIFDDAEVETNEYFSVILTSVTGGYLGPTNKCIVEIQDNDTEESPAKGADDAVTLIKPAANGKIIIAGKFSSVNGIKRDGLARINPDGSIDSTFSPTLGESPTISALLVTPDNKVIVAGLFNNIPNIGTTELLMLKEDGSIDETFTPGQTLGPVTIPPTPRINCLATSSDQSIFVAGRFSSYNGYGTAAIVKLATNGMIDTGFICNCIANIQNSSYPIKIQSIALQDDNKIIIGGFFSTISTNSWVNLARLNPDGSLDESFIPDTVFAGEVTALAIQNQSMIIAAGSFIPSYDIGLVQMVRFSSNGVPDLSFFSEIPFSGAINNIIVQSDGNILVGGDFKISTVNSYPILFRISYYGKIDRSFKYNIFYDPQIISLPYYPPTIALDPDNFIWVGGRFVKCGTTSAYRLIKLNNDGSIIGENQQTEVQMLIKNIQVIQNNKIKLVIQCTPNIKFQLLGSTNLIDWFSISELYATSNVVEFVDEPPAGEGNMFFRTKWSGNK